MSKVYADAVTATEANQDLTLGGSGDNVIVTAGATLKTNKIADAGGNNIITSDGSGTLTINSGFKGAEVLITTQVANNSASILFTSNIDSTYDVYIFKFISIRSATNNVELTFQTNASGETGYNENLTASFFGADHTENNTSAAVAFDTGRSLYDSTSFQALTGGQSNDADACGAGELHLFNPASTTYVKSFYATFNSLNAAPESRNTFAAGYFNITAAIDDIQFKMSSGNFDGTIKMYGVK